MKTTTSQYVKCGITFLAMLSFGGCAPAMMSPSTVPMNVGKNAELGFGVMAGKSHSPVIKKIEETSGMFEANATGADDHLNYNGWLRFNVDEEDISSSEIGLLGAAGDFSLLAGGVYWRKPLFKATESTQIGLQIEGGGFWIGAGVPMAFQLAEGLWVTVQPSIRGSLYSALHLPAGLSYEVADFFRIDLSGGIHSMVLPGYEIDSYLYYGAGALAFQF